jgi:hypothetical protein
LKWGGQLLGDAGYPREYGSSDFSPEALNHCANAIRILDEEVIQDAAAQLALTALENAAVICFLGFRYHGLNLQKLCLE